MRSHVLQRREIDSPVEFPYPIGIVFNVRVSGSGRNDMRWSGIAETVHRGRVALISNGSQISRTFWQMGSQSVNQKTFSSTMKGTNNRDHAPAQRANQNHPGQGG